MKGCVRSHGAENQGALLPFLQSMAVTRSSSGQFYMVWPGFIKGDIVCNILFTLYNKNDRSELDLFVFHFYNNIVPIIKTAQVIELYSYLPNYMT